MKKFKLITFYIKKPYLYVFRIAMLMLAAPLLFGIYETFATGVVHVKSFERTREESFFWFHVFVFYKIILAALLIWLGTGGAKEKLDDGGGP